MFANVLSKKRNDMKDKIKKILSSYKVLGAKQDLITDELCVLLGVMPSIILTQTWIEDEEDKNGWVGSGWNEPNGYVLDDVIEEDKYYNSTKAIFTYSA